MRGLPGFLALGIAFWRAIAAAWWHEEELAVIAGCAAVLGLILLWCSEPTR